MAHPPQPLRVLVVDDDAMVRELLAFTLEAEGYAVSGADSGDSALALLGQPGPPPQVILADIQMPGTTGAQLARKLRRACVPQTLLLAMSGSDPQADAISPYDGFLLKPFTARQFAAALASVKRGPRTPASAAAKAKPRTRPSPIPGSLTSIAASAAHPASNNGMASAAAILNDAAILNEKIYEQLASSMPASQLREMYVMCLNDARQRIANMRDLARAGDRARLSREAHSIKGGAGMLGATELYTLAEQLETIPPGPSQTDPFAEVNSLDKLADACDRLERILASRA
jgi:CheY-like chemotaxis protein/HPt (histidine-containing phosphotransfer) domain-containing protein